MQRAHASARAAGSWLHSLLLATAYAEAGEVQRPRSLLQAALRGEVRSPIVARNLAVLEPAADGAWPLFEEAWNRSLAPPPAAESAEVGRRLRQNVADEVLQFLVGNLPGAATASLDTASVWWPRLVRMSGAAQAA